MTDVRHLFYCLSLLFMLTACGSGSDLAETPDNPLPGGGGTSDPLVTNTVSLAFSVSGTADQQTRSGADIIQQTGQPFRGLTDLRFISFLVNREVQENDTPYPVTVSGGESTDGKGAKFFFYNSLEMNVGTRSMLVYAKAKGINGKGDEAQNGSTIATYPTNLSPSGITFSPERIFTGSVTTTAGDGSDAEKIAKYLTDIANTNVEGWTDHELRQNFIGKGAVAPTLIAGSSASVNAYVAKLVEEFGKTGESALKTAVMANINNKPEQLTKEAKFYPASIGLPDGAAALKWDGNKFVPQTTTTMQGVNSLNVFAYPAELCYYCNSQLRTSDNAVSHTGYSSATDWKENVLPNYGSSHGVVSSTTSAVAIEQPLQYGVARLDVTIKAQTTKNASNKDILLDGGGNEIEVGAQSFPLTGIIVGGQRRVGFNFKPLSASDQQSMVYDKYVMKDNDTKSFLLSTDPTDADAVHTLLLQSFDGEDVTIILEFENNCKDGENNGIAFKGMDGMINPDTKFYLIGTILKPTEESGKDYTKRVFTQDHVTKGNIEIKSLSRAYNAVPDLFYEALSSFQVVNVDIKPWSEKAMNHSVYNW